MENREKRALLRMMNYKKQQGAVLLVSIILLLVITIIGISAVNSSGIKTQVAGNSIYTMLVYQGAESALAKTASDSDLFNLAEALLKSPGSHTVDAAFYLPPENIAAGGTLISNADISYDGIFGCPAASGMATSTTIDCQIFKVDAVSRLKLTNARDRHIQGIAIPAP
jgi:type IV pilus assembly protein PilX